MTDHIQKSSRLLASDTAPEGLGFVVLGTLADGRTVFHVAPYFGVQEQMTEFANVPLVFEAMQPQFPEAAKVEVLYDPTPEPFRWDVFAEAHPDLAALLMPHQWSGE